MEGSGIARFSVVADPPEARETMTHPNAGIPLCFCDRKYKLQKGGKDRRGGIDERRTSPLFVLLSHLWVLDPALSIAAASMTLMCVSDVSGWSHVAWLLRDR